MLEAVILSLLVLLLIIYIKDTIEQKSKNNYRGALYYRLTNTNRILVIISILVFIIVTIIEYKTFDKSWESFWLLIINALSIAIITMPITISNCYITTLTDEEKLFRAKYVVTNIYDKKMIDRFNKAGINVIILTKEEIDTKIKTISERAYKKEKINGNLIIKTNDLNFIDNLNNAIYEFDSLKKCYNEIKEARKKADTIARILKYNFLTYFPLLILYFILTITRYPVIYNLLGIIVLKLITIIITEFVYKYIPSDVDIMERQPIEDGKLIGKQEKFFLIFTAIFTAFSYSLPYQFIIYMYDSYGIYLALGLLYTIVFFNNIFITYTLYSENALIKNIIKGVKNFRIIITTLFFILLIIETNNEVSIGFLNILTCLVIGLLPLLVLEIIKLARYTSIKKGKKYESKNDKKHQRS